MFYKIISTCFILTAATNSSSFNINIPMIIAEGYVTTTDIYEPVIFNISSTYQVAKKDTYIFEFYEQNILKKSHSVLGSEMIKGFKVNYPAFTKRGEAKDMKIKIKYKNQSVMSKPFTIYSCEKKGYSNYTESSQILKITNPIITKFKIDALDNYSETNYEYEYISTTGMKAVYNEFNRYVSFEEIELLINTLKTYEIEEISSATIRFYTDFPDSDFKSIAKNTVDVEFSLIRNGNRFFLANDYRFYQDQYNGAIYQHYNDRCGDTLHPFFIPQNCLDKSINYAVVFSNIGINKNDYYVRGTIQIERTLWGDSNSKFFYETVNTPLIDVEYEE